MTTDHEDGAISRAGPNEDDLLFFVVRTVARHCLSHSIGVCDCAGMFLRNLSCSMQPLHGRENSSRQSKNANSTQEASILLPRTRHDAKPGRIKSSDHKQSRLSISLWAMRPS